MSQQLDGMFYQAIEDQDWDETAEVMENKLLWPWKTSEISLVLFLSISCWNQCDH